MPSLLFLQLIPACGASHPAQISPFYPVWLLRSLALCVFLERYFSSTEDSISKDPALKMNFAI